MIYLVLWIILIGELYDEYLDSCNDSYFGSRDNHRYLAVSSRTLEP